jgi:hypothetical protein
MEEAEGGADLKEAKGMRAGPCQVLGRPEVPGRSSSMATVKIWRERHDGDRGQMECKYK